ncbi:MAG: glycosyltransferase family 4 protein [Pseudomonadota bacterium]
MKILHCHSTFSLGGKEARAVRLMNVFGDAAEHVILSAVPDALGARDAIDPAIRVSFPGDAAPSLCGKPALARYRDLREYMRGFDLVLTYNWGAMDAVAARRCRPAGQPPLIHHEDGFNADEGVRLNWKRNWFRRLMLPTATRLVVPSRRLEGIARTVWKQSAKRILRIPNGIDVGRYAGAPEEARIPGFTRAPGDIIVGTLAGLRSVKNLPRLVRAIAAQPPHVKLLIIGDGPERDAIVGEAVRVGIAGRVLLVGFLADPYRYIGHFDMFALSSDSEQFPISLVEAMAAGLPVVATDVGDVKAMVAAENQAFIVDVADEVGFAAALSKLSADQALRNTIGAANKVVAIREYDEAAMIESYRKLYQI